MYTTYINYRSGADEMSEKKLATPNLLCGYDVRISRFTHI